MWIVDSSVWIDYFGGKVTPQTDLLQTALGWQAIALGDIILCEVLQGYRRQHDFYAARQALLLFPVYTVGGTEIALKSAENYRALRHLGIAVRRVGLCRAACASPSVGCLKGFCCLLFPVLVYRPLHRRFAPLAEWSGSVRAL